MIIDLEKINQEYWKQNPADFVTHYNYVECLRQLSEKISLRHKINTEGRLLEDSRMDKKIGILGLTRKSLEGEYSAIAQNPEYSIVCISWVAVKSYYLIYYSQCIFLTLLCADNSFLNRSHEKTIGDINRLLTENKIEFDRNVFNQVFTLADVRRFKTKMENVRFLNVDIRNRCRQILKKLADYRLIGFASKEKIKDFRTKAAQKQRDEFLQNEVISFNNFFYEYRLKANYRDLSFLDQDINTANAVNYFNAYYGITMNFYVAYKNAINDLAKLRLGREILI